MGLSAKNARNKPLRDALNAKMSGIARKNAKLLIGPTTSPAVIKLSKKLNKLNLRSRKLYYQLKTLHPNLALISLIDCLFQQIKIYQLLQFCPLLMQIKIKNAKLHNTAFKLEKWL